MSFLMLPLAAGAAAVMIPLLIHLLHRQKSTRIEWGAMQFLLETVIQQKRRQHVEHWLLMLVRMGVVALLALLLARPILTSRTPGPLGAGAADVAVVIDHSLSTGRLAAGRDDVSSKPNASAAGNPGAAAAARATVFDQSVAIADRIAADLKPGDTLSVVVAEHRPRDLTPLPVQGAAGVKAALDALRGLSPGRTDASMPEAIAAARRLAARGRNVRKVVFVLSDEQRGGWAIDDATAWRAALTGKDAAVPSAPTAPSDPNLAVFSVRVAAATDAANLSVGELRVKPDLVSLDRPAEITATLADTGGADAPAAAVQLFVDGKLVASQQAEGVKAGQSRTIRFQHAFTEAGSHPVEIRVDAADALAADNAAAASVTVWKTLPVLVIDNQLTGAAGAGSGGEFRSSQFLQAAMQPVAEASAEAATLIQPKIVGLSDAGGLDLDDFAAVVVNDVHRLPAGFLDRLGDYAKAGHGVWLIFGPHTTASFANEDLTRAGLGGATLAEPRRAAPPAAIEVRDPNHPMVTLLTAAERNAMTGTAASQWWEAKLGEGQRVILAAGGSPLVVERPVGRTGGTLVTWLTSADGTWNNLPLSNAFVPLVQETVYRLAAAATRDARSRSIDAGQPIVWTAPAKSGVTSLRVTPPGGKPVTIKTTARNGKLVAAFPDTGEPGLYELQPATADPKAAPATIYYAAGIDRRELDPATVSDADLTWLKTGGYIRGRLAPGAIPAALGSGGGAGELWPWLAAVVLGLLLWETWITRRMARLRGGSTAANAGMRLVEV